MLGSIHKFLLDTRGSIAPLTAVLLPIMLGATGLGIDVSVWMKNKRDLQAAADAAVIAAAWDIANGANQETAEASGTKEAVNNGFENSGSNTLTFSFSESEEGNDVIGASLSVQDITYFSKILFKGDIFTAAAAASAVIVPQGDYCMLSLNGTADGAITAVGNVEINSVGCGIAVNSNSDSALDLSGSVDIEIKDLNIVGDYETTGSVDLEAETINTNATRVPDPYEDLAVPEYSGCDYNGNTRINGDGELDPGVYCGNISIRGNGTVIMNPGVYIIDGGDFTVSGGGEIIAEGVSIILTSSDEDGDNVGLLNISGNKEMTISAPEPGDDMEGVAFYQDRIASESNQCNSLTGTSVLDVMGAIYFPSQCLDIGGNADAVGSSDSPCSRVIADTIRLHGTPNIGNNCTGLGVEDIGTISVRLIL